MKRLHKLNVTRLEPRVNPTAGVDHLSTNLQELLTSDRRAGLVFDDLDRVAVRITADDVPRAIRNLAALDFGLFAARPDSYFLDGWLPQSAIPAIETLGDEGVLDGAFGLPPTSTGQGVVLSEAVHVHQAVRVQNHQPTGYSGTGVNVGVISDSFSFRSQPSFGGFTGVAADQKSGDLPSSFFFMRDDSIPSSRTDEGRGMLQLVYDVAPGAGLGFASGTSFPSETAIATAVNDLRANGADVIVDDLLHPFEPYFQDSEAAKAYTTAKSAGVVGVSMAFNTSNNAYTTSGITTTTDAFFTGTFLDFDPGAGVDNRNSISVPANAKFGVVLQWDDPFYVANGTKTDLNFYIINAANNTVISSSAGNSVAGNMPFEYVSIDNTGGSPLVIELLVEYVAANSSEAPGRIFIRPDQGTPQMQWSGSPAIQGHNGSADVITVGAADFWDQRNPAAYTALGPVTHLYNASGTAYGSPFVIIKPDVAAASDTNTTFFGGSNPDNDSRPNFNGTSAAAPVVAAIAALVLEKNPTWTPAQVKSAILASAEDAGTPGWDPLTGHGLVNAAAAVTGFVVPAQLPYSFGFESQSLDNAWGINSFGNGRIRMTADVSAAAGSHALLLDSFYGSTKSSLNEANLYLNTNNAAEVLLSFSARNMGDADNGGVLFSVDGGVNYFTLLVDEHIPNTWTPFTFNLSREAANYGVSIGAETIVRFQQVGKGAFNTPGNKDGLAFDAISITAAAAADTIWDGDAIGDDSWSNPLNWSGNSLPTTNSRVLIPAGFDVFADLGTCKSLYTYSPVLVGTSLTVGENVQAYATVTLDGGSFTHNGTFNAYKGLHWKASAIFSPAGTGTLIIPAGQTLLVNGGAHGFYSYNIENSGTLNWASGDIYSGTMNGASRKGLNLLASSTTTIDGDVDWLYDGAYYEGAAHFTAHPGATITHTGSGETTIAGPLDLIGGTISITGGSLNSTGGGAWNSFTLTQGLLESTSGIITPSQGAIITGNGIVRINGGTLRQPANTASVFNNLDLYAGFIEGKGTVTINGVCIWRGGDQAEGKTVYGTNSMLQMEEAQARGFYSRTMETYGSVLWVGGDIYSGSMSGQSPGSWTTKPGSSFTLLSDADWFFNGTFYDSAAPLTLASGATLTRSSDNNETLFEGALHIQGTLTINDGSIAGSGGGTFQTSTVNGKLLRLIGGVFSPAHNASIGGSGTIRVEGGTLRNNVNQIATFHHFQLHAGRIDGWGTIIVNGNADWRTGDMFDNGKTIFLNSLTLSGTMDRGFYSRIIESSGATTWSSGDIYSGSISGQPAGGWTVQSGGQFNVTGSNDWLFNGSFSMGAAPFTLANSATFSRISNVNQTTFHGAFNSHGSIAVNTGQLALIGGGTWGSTSIPTGSPRFSGGVFSLSPGAAVTGNGTLTIDGGILKNDLSHVASIDNLVLTGIGTIAGEGTIAVSKTWTWNSGDLVGLGHGTLNLLAGSVTNINTASVRGLYNRHMINAGTVNWNGGDMTSGRPDGSTGSGVWVVGNSGILNFNSDADLLFNGSFYSPPTLIEIAGGSLKKTSTGTTLLDGGVTITSGTLSGIGTLETTLVHSGGSMSPGNDVGTLTLHGNYMQGGPLAIDFNGPLSGAFDCLTVNGGVSLNAALDVNAAATLAIGDSIVIVNNDDSDVIAGTFTGLPQGTRFVSNGKLLQINYTGGSGNDVTLTVIAPPVVSVPINGGAIQRSRLTSAVVNFASPQNAALLQVPGAITFSRGSTIVNTANGLNVSPTSGMVTSVNLTFANIINSGVEHGSLADGQWRLAIPSLGYQSDANDPSFRRLFGDFNGDGNVDGGSDFAEFRFETTANNPFDWNADGTIDGGTDFAQFGTRFGRTV